MFKALLGNPVGRMITGTIAGGIFGGVTNNDNTNTGKFNDILRGAFIGGGIAASGNLLWSGVKAGAGAASRAGYWGTTKALAKGAWGVTKNTAKLSYLGTKTSLKAANWALEHPKTVIGGIGAGYGMYALSQSGSGVQHNDLSVNGMAQLAMQNNISSTGFNIGEGASINQAQNSMFENRINLENSTYGLVQGMHRGRHGG